MATSTNSYATSEPTVIPSRIARLMDDITASMELKAARVAAGEQPEDAIEKGFENLLETAKENYPRKSQTMQQRMAQPLATFAANRRYKAFAGIDPTKPGAIRSVDLAALHRSEVEYFAANWVHIPSKIDGLLKEDRLVPQSDYTKLRFYLNKVKCEEVTPGFAGLPVGDDEIWCGGVFIDETGAVTQAKHFLVSDEFGNGDWRPYEDAGKLMQWFNLTEGGNKFPKIYTAVITLVDEDWGNIGDWFNDQFEKIKDAVNVILKAVGFVFGEVLGLGELGALFAGIVTGIFSWLVGWIVEVFDNDLVGTRQSYVTVNGYGGIWIGSGTHRITNTAVFDTSGEYRVTYTWEFAK